MEQLLVLLGLGILAGPFLGIIAYFKVRSVRQDMERLREEVSALRRQISERAWGALAAEEKRETRAPEKPLQQMPAATPQHGAEEHAVHDPVRGADDESIKSIDSLDVTTTTSPTTTSDSEVQAEQIEATEEPSSLEDALATASHQTRGEAGRTAPLPPPDKPFVSSIDALRKSDRSMEMMLGTKWLNWVGALFLIIFVGYGLKYSYDNAWIGPQGRLAIGTFFGMVALALGEHFRRRNWSILFQTLTGLGIAIFYACVFFSFQIYKLSSPTLSFGLATGVTALAVFLAVLHNTASIAILGVIGGFLSPVLISTGQNQPYVLFSYILVLDLVAMAAAYFRRWHALDLLCFVGTVLMLTGWYSKFGHLDGQLTPALLFTSLFYGVFLVIPTLHALVRRETGSREGTVLIVGNALFSAAMFYRLLYPQHSQALGFVILGQAVAMFILFRAWVGRTGSANLTAHSLLVLALCLVVMAVPLHLSRYGLSIVWALQGALLTYIGLRYRSNWTRGIALGALALAGFSLFRHMPLHTAAFVPVLNLAFGSWVLVAGTALFAAWLTLKRSPEGDEYRHPISVSAFLIGFGLLWLLPAFESSVYWRFNYQGHHRNSYSAATIVVIWSAMSAGLVWLIQRRRELHEGWHLLAGTAFIVTGLAFLFSLAVYDSTSTMLAINGVFLPRALFVVALLWAGRLYMQGGREGWQKAFESIAHIALVMLTAVELKRWGFAYQGFSDKVAFSLISLAWGLHAFILIWLGLWSRQRFRRILGFALFGLVIVKVLFVDTSELETGLRILSFGGAGVLLITASIFFTRYSAALLQEDEERAVADG